MELIRRYLWNNLIALDQAVNTLLGGDPDMTLSGRMGRDIKNKRCRLCLAVCWLLNKIDSNHCQKQEVTESDEGRDAVL